MKKSTFTRLIAVLTAALILSLSLVSCKGSSDDLSAVKSKGKLIVGITEYPPMDYQNEGSDEWVGFDADMAKEFAKKLGVTAEFVVIDWGTKIAALAGGTIDCVWNGMTLTDEVSEGMGVSAPYCKNAQVVILPADKIASYTDVASLKDLNFAVETGSAGMDALKALGYKYTEVKDQAAAVLEVNAGTSDACVVDLLLAGALIGEGSSYSNLKIAMKLNEEEFFVVGFRKSSNLVDEFNKFWSEAEANGTLDTIAKKNGVQESIIKTSKAK